MSTGRLVDTLTNRGVPMHPDKLEMFENQELTLFSFEFREGLKRESVMLTVADADGTVHLIFTSGEAVVRLLHSINQEGDLPALVKFVRQPTGSGRKVWVMQ